jgi:hypothetical protein
MSGFLLSFFRFLASLGQFPFSSCSSMKNLIPSLISLFYSTTVIRASSVKRVSLMNS